MRVYLSDEPHGRTQIDTLQGRRVKRHSEGGEPDLGNLQWFILSRYQPLGSLSRQPTFTALFSPWVYSPPCLTMRFSKAIRLILLSRLASVAASLHILKDGSPVSLFTERDAIPASSEWTFLVQEDGTYILRNRKTGENMHFGSADDVPPEEARAVHFPGQDAPEPEEALSPRDPDYGDASDPKMALVKRVPADNLHIGEANSTCFITGQITHHPIEMRTWVNYGGRVLKLKTTGKRTFHILEYAPSLCVITHTYTRPTANNTLWRPWPAHGNVGERTNMDRTYCHGSQAQRAGCYG